MIDTEEKILELEAVLADGVAFGAVPGELKQRLFDEFKALEGTLDISNETVRLYYQNPYTKLYQKLVVNSNRKGEFLRKQMNLIATLETVLNQLVAGQTVVIKSLEAQERAVNYHKKEIISRNKNPQEILIKYFKKE